MIKLIRSDYFVLGFALSLVVLSFLIFWKPAEKANQLEIYVQGKRQYVFDLLDNKVIDIPGRLGISRVEINNGKARIIKSVCSTQYCVRSGWLENSAGLLACLPNGVSLRMVGGLRKYDAINF